jgi:DNA polymerase I-like protein with 3'-5' exonuclease and polymerase domains
MMDDYLYGLKPAKLIVLMLRLGPATVQRMSRDALKVACRSVDEDERIDPNGWQYFAAKQVQHGTNYGLGIPKMADNILKKAYKEKGQMIIVSKQECQRLQDCYLLRYPGIKMWQQWVQNEVDTRRCLDSGSGHVRRFFGRTGDHATYREAYAHEPQINTTFATNKALERLLVDPENRDERGLFRIKPVHHVHDALIGQFRKQDTDWAVARIRTYFDNPMQIANQTILIPFEGAFGPSWGQLGEVYGGGRI